MRREYPEAPIVAVGVIIRQGNQIVLIRRGKEPSKGLWTFPGGAVELGETVQDAARREVLEETGLEVELGKVAIVLDNIMHDGDGRVRYHYTIIDFMAVPVGGDLRPGSDVSETMWAGVEDLDGLETTLKAKEVARELLGGRVPASGG